MTRATCTVARSYAIAAAARTIAEGALIVTGLIAAIVLICTLGFMLGIVAGLGRHFQ